MRDVSLGGLASECAVAESQAVGAASSVNILVASLAPAFRFLSSTAPGQRAPGENFCHGGLGQEMRKRGQVFALQTRGKRAASEGGYLARPTRVKGRFNGKNWDYLCVEKERRAWHLRLASVLEPREADKHTILYHRSFHSSMS